uniref:Endo-1,4-beta-xylanase D-like n=1 Tax=Nicotiana tabacum TaxID=4097 RepID=A0A1S3Y4F9_TOBAC|nr:PREDICTED: endo-1,4-beta-xylanase D-like [Nicotiana tabacum]
MPLVRKAKVKIQAVDSQGQSLPNATVSLAQQKNNFPFGNAISQHILNNKAYQDWFTSRFMYTVFENEMKWYANEKIPGQLDYNVADAMLSLVQKYNIKVRGHNVFWDNPQNMPSWARYLSPAQLSATASRRINSVMNRYLGQLIHWDVVNENVHFSFLEQMLGKNASAVYYTSRRDDAELIRCFGAKSDNLELLNPSKSGARKAAQSREEATRIVAEATRRAADETVNDDGGRRFHLNRPLIEYPFENAVPRPGRALGDYARPVYNHGLSSVSPPPVAMDNFELKQSLLQTIQNNYIFRGKDNVKHWLCSLPTGSIRTWKDMTRKFLDKYFSAAKTVKFRREIQNFCQTDTEKVFEA